jgi:malonate transporter
MLDVLAITGPIYLCIVAGYAAVLAGLFSKADMRVLGKFVLEISLPTLLFHALASRRLAEVVRPDYLLAYTVGSLLVLLGGLWWSWKVRGRTLTESAYMAMGMTCANSGYVGYPLMLLLFGPLAGVILALNFMVENLLKLPLLFALADAGAHGGQRPTAGQVLRQTAARLIRNPIVIGILLGLLVSLSGWSLPPVVARAVSLLGAAAGGLALFIIGGGLYGLQVKGMRAQVGEVALGKLVLHPLAVWGAIALLGALGAPAPSGELKVAAVLSAAMPMLGVYAILAQRHGHEAVASAALVATTALSFVSISAALWLMRLSPAWLG